MKRIVLVDGENLTYGLCVLLGNKAKKTRRSVLDNYDFRGLIEELLIDLKPQEILWFGARLRQYKATPELLQKSKAAIKDQSFFVNRIQKQKITFIKVGYLRLRESDPCKNCQHQEWKFIEKGVDVGLAVRMLTEADKNTELVVISADTDLLPAVREARRKGAQVMFIGYEYRPINALSNAANSTRLITKPIARKHAGVNNG